jgi:hypothetical protein
MPFDETTPPLAEQPKPKVPETDGSQQNAGEDELPPHPDENPDEAAGNVGEIAVGEAPTIIPVTDGNKETIPEGWEPNADRAYSMASDKVNELETAASLAERVGRPEKAEELHQSADVEAQKGAEKYDLEQQREAEKRVIEARKEENRRRDEEERRQRLEKEVNELVDMVLEAVDLPPDSKMELLDGMADLPGDERKVNAFYERLGLTRPAEDDAPAFSWDVSQGGPSHFVGSTQIESTRSYVVPTSFGVAIRETRYKPGHQYDLNSPRVRLTVEKTPAETEQAA